MLRPFRFTSSAVRSATGSPTSGSMTSTWWSRAILWHWHDPSTPKQRSTTVSGPRNLLIDGSPVDIAMARTEKYTRPGSLPEVTPGNLQEDLIRRDFTINAMAISIEEDAELIDPFNGLRDLESGVLRVLHEDSFIDDPTRALRAARYAARFGFDLEPTTAELLFATDTGSVTRERIENELLLMAGEDNALESLRLARVWGLVDFEEDRLELAERAVDLSETEPWAGEVSREEVILEAIFGRLDGLASLLEEPESAWKGSPDRQAAQAGRADPCPGRRCRMAGPLAEGLALGGTGDNRR